MQLAIEKRGYTAVIMVWTTRLDRKNAGMFLHLMAPILTSCAHVVIDLRKVTAIDSHGLGSLLTCRHRLAKRGGRLTLCHGHEEGDIFPELFRRARIFSDGSALGTAL